MIIVKGRYSPKEKMTAWAFRAGFNKKISETRKNPLTMAKTHDIISVESERERKTLSS
jgi:hypothetical protein